MSERTVVPSDGKWRRATWPGAAHEPEWTAVIGLHPGDVRNCYGANLEGCSNDATTIAVDSNGDAYACCEGCRPILAEEEGS